MKQVQSQGICDGWLTKDFAKARYSVSRGLHDVIRRHRSFQ